MTAYGVLSVSFFFLRASDVLSYSLELDDGRVSSDTLSLAFWASDQTISNGPFSPLICKSPLSFPCNRLVVLYLFAAVLPWSENTRLGLTWAQTAQPMSCSPLRQVGLAKVATQSASNRKLATLRIQTHAEFPSVVLSEVGLLSYCNVLHVVTCDANPFQLRFHGQG